MSLTLENISLTVDGEIYLDDISASFEAGHFNCLLGPTLAGKTSLLRLVAGLEKPTHGHIHLGGNDITDVAARRRNVAFVYQQFINYPNLSVFENIASPLRVAKTDDNEVKKRVGDIADLLGLSAFLGRKPLELSGGQQQRVSIARALVKDADIILLDEPLANLDYKLREELRAELPALLEAKGSTILYATTEPEEALQLGDQVYLMHEGRIAQSGKSAEVYAAPINLIAAKTFSDPPLNCYAANGSGENSQFLGLKDGETIAVKPHHVKLDVASDGDIALSARVLGADITGADSYLHLDVDGHTWTALVSGTHLPETGTNLDISIRRADIMTFDASGTVQKGTV